MNLANRGYSAMNNWIAVPHSSRHGRQWCKPQNICVYKIHLINRWSSWWATSVTGKGVLQCIHQDTVFVWWLLWEQNIMTVSTNTASNKNCMYLDLSPEFVLGCWSLWYILLGSHGPPFEGLCPHSTNMLTFNYNHSTSFPLSIKMKRSETEAIVQAVKCMAANMFLVAFC